MVKWSPVQRQLSRAVYSELYLASLEDSVAGTASFTKMTQAHNKSVGEAITSSSRDLIEKLRAATQDSREAAEEL